MSQKFVTDDHTSIDVAIQFGLRNNMMSICEHDGTEHYHLEDKDVPIMINSAPKAELLKIHFELGELYYHPTEKGIEFLDSKNHLRGGT